MDLVSTYLSYRLVKLLGTPFENWEAFKLGIIDSKGKIIKEPETSEEKRSFTSFERIIKNIKIAISKLVGYSKAAAILSTIYLLRDNVENLEYIDSIINEEVEMPVNAIKNLANKAGISMDRAEHLWDKAKEHLKKQYPDVEEKSEKYYEILMGIFKNSAGLREDSTAAELPALIQPMEIKSKRKPDDKLHGIYYFDIDDEDGNISKMLDGKRPYQRWREIITDKGIRDWANSNIKPFSVRLKKSGVHIRIR
jgi:hypothetical protein